MYIFIIKMTRYIRIKPALCAARAARRPLGERGEGAFIPLRSMCLSLVRSLVCVCVGF